MTTLLSPSLLLAFVACKPGTQVTDSLAGDPVEVTTVTPADLTVDVSPSTAIVVVLSETIDAASVTEASVQVSISGELVPVTRTVTANTIELTSEQPWLLRSDVEVELTTDVLSTEGAPLGGPFRSEFQVRDGSWDTLPTVLPPWVHSSHPYALPVGNREGQVVFPLPDFIAPLAASKLSALTYVPDTGEFDVVDEVRPSAAGLDFEDVVGGLNHHGDTLIVSRHLTGLFVDELTTKGWRRRNTTRPTALGSRYKVAVGDDGELMAAWDQGDDVVFAMFDDSTASWSRSTVMTADADLWQIVQLDNGDLEFLYKRADGGLSSINYRSEEGFGRPSQISPSNESVNWARMSRAPGGASLTWQHDGTEIRTARLDASTASWTDEVVDDGSGGAEVCHHPSGLRIAAYRDADHALASVAQPGEAFSSPQILSDTSGFEFAWCFLDEAGNGHGLWASYGSNEVYWARFVDGAWQEAQDLDLDTSDVRGWFPDPQGRMVLFYSVPGEVRATRFR